MPHTPLLVLLDGLLARDQQRVDDAVEEIANTFSRFGGGQLQLKQSPLHSKQALLYVVEALLSVSPEATKVKSDHDQSLPLHFAASLGMVDVAQLILSKFPEAISTPNEKGKIPLHYAAREGRLQMVNFFLSVAPYTAAVATKKHKLALHFAAGDGHEAVVDSLLAVYPRGASLVSKKGKLPLHFAARWGHVRIARQLLSYYPDALRSLDWEGNLPLHDAAREGQYLMSRILVDSFPDALSTANLRGEIPLFPAVRSGNLDLVIYMLSVWPAGGKHILQSVKADDNPSDWNWEILEMLLRGAVDNFDNCSAFHSIEPPAVFLSSSASVNASVPRWDKKMIKNFNPQLHPPLLVGATEVFTKKGKGRFARSKSPTLDDDNEGRNKKSRKRQRTATAGSGFEYEMSKISCRTFFPLHAALECRSSYHVLQHVVSMRPLNVTAVDDLGRYPLHWAAMHPSTDNNDDNDNNEWVELVINKLVHLEAASKRDISGRLPLHWAILCHADVRLIDALLKVYPSSVVEPCNSLDDEWQDAHPVEMAIGVNSDLSTLYSLIRVDPAYVSTANCHC